MEYTLYGGQEENDFGEFRRKVRSAELLSASTERLLRNIRFTGKVSVMVQNGHILKSGYEEGYFRQDENSRAAEKSGRHCSE